MFMLISRRERERLNFFVVLVAILHADVVTVVVVSFDGNGNYIDFVQYMHLLS